MQAAIQYPRGGDGRRSRRRDATRTACVACLGQRPLDRQGRDMSTPQPFWELWFLPTPTPSGCVRTGCGTGAVRHRYGMVTVHPVPRNRRESRRHTKIPVRGASAQGGHTPQHPHLTATAPPPPPRSPHPQSAGCRPRRTGPPCSRRGRGRGLSLGNSSRGSRGRWRCSYQGRRSSGSRPPAGRRRRCRARGGGRRRRPHRRCRLRLGCHLRRGAGPARSPPPPSPRRRPRRRRRRRRPRRWRRRPRHHPPRRGRRRRVVSPPLRSAVGATAQQRLLHWVGGVLAARTRLSSSERWSRRAERTATPRCPRGERSTPPP
ncbi:hypothetical protein BU14_0084s0013 [Porphyra umbilicalis]|uniref:Uncharacterized protein n=1 Tax=Porphyra umbilicalis TaxID=2786 RepID=A0A1X6PEA2_PORUM|nr:hypothetical protein BU14_0084s0013 [Porphyra umbilicalis]|eukprot:OSX79199.1 hypothetical protein BU14_0084s0013 [Porphyra umbilicalis]